MRWFCSCLNLGSLISELPLHFIDFDSQGLILRFEQIHAYFNLLLSFRLRPSIILSLDSHPISRQRHIILHQIHLEISCRHFFMCTPKKRIPSLQSPHILILIFTCMNRAEKTPDHFLLLPFVFAHDGWSFDRFDVSLFHNRTVRQDSHEVFMCGW